MMEVIYMIVLAVAIAISLAAFYAVLHVFFERRISKTRDLIQDTPGRAALVGLINLAFFMVVALALFALGNWVGVEFFGVIGVLVLVPPSIGIVFGLGGAVRLVGERLYPDASNFRRTAGGAVTLALACALPFVGWFALLPFVCTLGLGAFILSFFRTRARDAEGVDVVVEETI
jgi:hypothetical protein